MSTEPRISPVPPAAAGGVPPAPAATTDDHHPSVLPAVLDRIGFSRAQFWVLMLIMAGMFFDTLEQNSTGAMGTNLKDALGIDNDQLALINTATVIGGLIGRLVGGYLADRYGRRLSLGFNLLLYTLGGLISAVAVNYEMLLASRLLVGIGLGGEFTVGIAMLSEMVATRYRGTLVSTLNIGSGGIGNFLSYGIFFLILGPFAGFFGGDDTVWRWTYVLLSVPALLVVVYRRRLPESPRYLISRGEVDAANRELTRLASDTLRRPRADAPVTPYLSAADVPARQPRVSPAAVFQGKALPRTLAIGAASWMAFGAQVTLNFLMPTLLVAKGYSISDSLLFTMIMNVGSLLGACAAAVLASRAGRRTTVTTAAVLGCLTAVAFALFAETARRAGTGPGRVRHRAEPVDGGPGRRNPGLARRSGHRAVAGRPRGLAPVGDRTAAGQPHVGDDLGGSGRLRPVDRDPAGRRTGHHRPLVRRAGHHPHHRRRPGTGMTRGPGVRSTGRGPR